MKRFFVFVLGLLSIISCSQLIVELEGDIQGVVKDYSHGGMINNCLVTITPGGKSVTTTPAGIYEFKDLEGGDYTLTFSKAGYSEESIRVEVIPGQVSQADIMLKPLSAFSLSHTEIDFGDYETNKVIYLYNNTDSGCAYEASNIPQWLSLNSTTGTVPAGSQLALTVTVDRSRMEYGRYSQILTFSYSGNGSGSVTLAVKCEKVEISAPSVTCAASAENVTETSFSINGAIVKTGGQQVTSYGHCWSLNPSPTVDDYKTLIGTTSSVCEFTSEVTDLTTGTKYYVRAYAVNSQGISYSDEVVVTTQEAYSDQWDGTVAQSFESGSGTSSKPYVITTGAQLMLMKDYPDKHFVLANNIDLNNINWKPFEFNGNLDGKGYVISNLYIKRTGNFQGLFSSATTNASVRNLTISGVRIDTPESNYVGAIVGSFSGTGIDNCRVIFKEGSEISGLDYVGGVVGIMDGFVSGCVVESQIPEFVINGLDYVGGVAGGCYNSCCDRCMVNANIGGRLYVGGIVGEGRGSTYYPDLALNCGFIGKIIGNSSVGGIAGFSNAIIQACMVKIDMVVEDDKAGGICGYGVSSTIVACYADGNISAPRSAGEIAGLIGDAWNCHGELSYSTASCSAQQYRPFFRSDGGLTDCATVFSGSSSYGNVMYNCTDITTFIREAYSKHADLWNLNNTWTWTGTVDGKEVSVSCPRLAWE